MPRKSGNIDLASLGVLKLLAAHADHYQQSGSKRAHHEGEGVSTIAYSMVDKTIYPSSFGLGARGEDKIPNPYQCSQEYTRKAVTDLLECHAIEYCRPGSKLLRMNNKGRVLLKKLEQGMSFADTLEQEDVKAIQVEFSEVEQRFRSAVTPKGDQRTRLNRDILSVRQGMLRAMAKASDDASGEVEEAFIKPIIYAKTINPSDLLLKDDDIVALHPKYLQPEPSASDFMTFAKYKGSKEWEKIFNPYQTSKVIRLTAWQQLLEEGYIKPGIDGDHVRLTEKGWDAVDELPLLKKESYTFMHVTPEKRLTAINPSVLLPEDIRHDKIEVGEVAEILVGVFGKNAKIAAALGQLEKKIRDQRGRGE